MQRKEPKYEDGTVYWQCSKCKQWLPETTFFSNKGSYNHLSSQCKKCHYETCIKTKDPDNARRISRECQRRFRQTNPEKYRERRRLQSLNEPKNERTKARQKLNNAVISGRIIRPTNCSQCGKLRKITAHHDDYSKPFEVRWLCLECHGKQTIIDNGNKQSSFN